MKESFYFDSNGKSLLGVYHAPAFSNDRQHGVVLCYPFGQEYVRTHRLFKQMAVRLSRDGYHVLRFDYFGTGDSAGELTDATINIWQENVHNAIEELHDCGDVQSVSLIGLRLGGAIAALAGAASGDVHSIALWDTVSNGETYWQSLETQHQNWLISHLVKPQSAGDVREIVGFTISDAFEKSVRQLDLSALQQSPAQHILILSNSENGVSGLENHLQKSGSQVKSQQIPEQQVWQESASLENFLVPNNSLQAIQDWLDEVSG
ncbi:MAG: hypothetical protein H6629_03880 [Calditrichae bacterium]|nr:hypothetical protein [Calditrichia bacterium]